MKVFVTGGSGFVGCRLSGRLVPGNKAPRSDLWALVGTFDDQS
jgi:nucleoside-diphosphate-sugar epimerase